MCKNTKKRSCAITGAGGYIGSVLAEFMRSQGWVVYELKHSIEPIESNNEFIVSYDLTDDPPLKILEQADALVHCAYDFKPIKWDDIYAVNVEGSARLLHAAKNAGVKQTVFLSSLSAFDECKSLYGKAKLLTEKEALSLGAIVVRPGVVYGSNKGGIIKSLTSIVSISTITPLVGRGNQLFFMTHESDLCELINNTCSNDTIEKTRPIVAASEHGKTFKEILTILAQAKGKRPFFIPINWRLMLTGLRFIECLGLSIGIRSDSLISMLNLNSKPDFDGLRKTGIFFRDFNIRHLKEL